MYIFEWPCSWWPWSVLFHFAQEISVSLVNNFRSSFALNIFQTFQTCRTHFESFATVPPVHVAYLPKVQLWAAVPWFLTLFDHRHSWLSIFNRHSLIHWWVTLPKVDLSMLTWMIPPVPSFSAALAYQQTCNKNSAVCSYPGKSCKGTVVNNSQSQTAAFGAYLATIPVVRSSKRLPAVEFFCLLQRYFSTIPVPVQVPTYSNDAVRVLDSKVGICSPEKKQSKDDHRNSWISMECCWGFDPCIPNMCMDSGSCSSKMPIPWHWQQVLQEKTHGSDVSDMI